MFSSKATTNFKFFRTDWRNCKRSKNWKNNFKAPDNYIPKLELASYFSSISEIATSDLKSFLTAKLINLWEQSGLEYHNLDSVLALVLESATEQNSLRVLNVLNDFVKEESSVLKLPCRKICQCLLQKDKIGKTKFYSKFWEEVLNFFSRLFDFTPTLIKELLSSENLTKLLAVMAQFIQREKNKDFFIIKKFFEFFGSVLYFSEFKYVYF